MQIELLTYTPEPELVVAAAARLCYSNSSIEALLEKSRTEREAFLEKITSLGHLSVLEHVSFSFGVEGISRACSHQLVRHRLASYSQQSQRYVSHSKRFSAVTPDSIAEHAELNQRYQQLLSEIHGFYVEMLDSGIPAEDARFILPNAATTKIVVTMNGRELLHFFELRCCRRAQWEIQRLAKEMLKLVKPLAPILFSKAGPGCVGGACPEGELTCGAINEVRGEFKHLV
ncbi:FAD-dependent thymidylate synthase [Geopsychrobacter electrodiphilus]|uniref:FAD-dependent thymidylate synthase n=1 Tax=Geopsychrobacter electrodiphilus TaxID=225196 RepID=UPI000360C408|nr:FAD-dependent thymidylate synthase [Geopsychrobacter electrodiphilus]